MFFPSNKRLLLFIYFYYYMYLNTIIIIIINLKYASQLKFRDDNSYLVDILSSIAPTDWWEFYERWYVFIDFEEAVYYCKSTCVRLSNW